ncbi:MAG: SprT-like domain-containing protein [Chloroflexota bacterium]
MATTTKEYSAFDYAYSWYNQTLFDSTLPNCLITLQRHRLAYGYYWPNRFQHRQQHEQTTDEIALNPDAFVGHPDKEILCTLVHEMAHLWQQHFGKPGKRGYHNMEWASKMELIGLMPSDTGLPGGKRTGYAMSDYAIPGGPFEIVTEKLLATGFVVNWQSNERQLRAIGSEAQTTTATPTMPKSRNKTKYSCHNCGLNAWAKPKARLICGDCQRIMSAT